MRNDGFSRFPNVLGKSGCRSRPPPKMCAGLVASEAVVARLAHTSGPGCQISQPKLGIRESPENPWISRDVWKHPSHGRFAHVWPDVFPLDPLPLDQVPKVNATGSLRASRGTNSMRGRRLRVPSPQTSVLLRAERQVSPPSSSRG